ncbi:porin [bacterium]|nr:porin [bacterium]MBU1989794.1 porin [bacterium]
MIDGIYISQLDESATPTVKEKKVEFEQLGMIHAKVAGKYETVKELPKQADNIKDVFKYADAYGKFRLAYINSAHKISSVPDKEEKSASSFGGEFGFNTAAYKGFSLHAGIYVSQSVEFVNPPKADRNEDFFARDLDSFAYVAESSIDYRDDYLGVKIGRVKVDTPYANSDDIRMAANTFEGGWAQYNYTPKLNTQIVYLNRWAGYDSQDEMAGLYQDEFKNLVDEESFGMLGASLSYEYDENSEALFWYNHIEGMSAIAYAEVIGIYFIDGYGLHLDYGLQYSNIRELDDSNVAGDVYGAMSILHYKGAFLGGAYNLAVVEDGKYITDGFGGGPYYTSLDEATLAAISEAHPGNNAKSFRVGAGYEFLDMPLDGMIVEFVYGELYNDFGRIKEKDAIISYDFEDMWHVEALYTSYESSSGKNSFDRALVRVDYSF